MPQFTKPTLTNKRKYDESNDTTTSSYKRQSTGQGSTHVSHDSTHNQSRDRFWYVQWRNPQQKKHKTWDGDGILLQTSTGFCNLLDMDSKRIANGKPIGISLSDIAVDAEFTVGNKDVCVEREVKREDYLSGKCFQGDIPSEPVVSHSAALTKPYVPLRPKTINGFKPPSFVASSSSSKHISSPHKAPSLRSKTPEPVHHTVNFTGRSYWSANWRKVQMKKNKTWDGDGFVLQKTDTLTFISDKGIMFGSIKWDGKPLCNGYFARVGRREFEIDCEVSHGDLPMIKGSSTEDTSDVDLETDGPSTPQVYASSSRPTTPSVGHAETPSRPTAIPAKSFYAHAKPQPKSNGPLHDPKAEGAIIMKSPNAEQAKKYNKKNAPIIPVVIDPILARKLRPHQIEGVKFMYECVMGLAHDGQGCILADEMGMGKTLQTITLVWTLLKQNPYAGIGPVVGKVLIVCPVSLINNWKNEFHKWLGRDRVGVFVVDKDKDAVKQFLNSRVHKVLIMGYERLRTVIKELAYCIPPIGLIICDEGHRLKSANNKTSKMFENLKTPRRIILSGTPIQNDLGEFHAMADFCNPGILEDYQSFRKTYEAPILKSRTPECSSKEKELGDGRLTGLMDIARRFVLRRDAGILKKYLPPKHEYVVFVTPTQLQRDIFQRILTRDNIDSISATHTAESLALINLLTKISNSPILLKATVDQARSKGDSGEMIKKVALEDAVRFIPERAQVEDVSLSGKLAALANLLRAIYKTTEEKCIIVSHYTSTLNIIEAFCRKKSYTYLRLDGQTAASKRQEYVNEFNKSSQNQRFIFLLSSKAGGVGLNLIGASRLCLIDSDWNPSHDLQSMARIHRDGQKRAVFIYRFLTAGTIDEKIFQRQVTKLGLSNSLIGDGKSGSKSDSFSKKDLRDIFTIHPTAACHTHDLLECPCTGDYPDIPDLGSDDESEGPEEMGFVSASQVKPEQIERMDKAYLKQKKAQLASLGEWKHINCLQPSARGQIHDSILQKLLYTGQTPRRRQSAPGDQDRDSIGLESQIEECSNTYKVTDVPGGSVSFLFERGTKSAADNGEEEPLSEDI